MSLLCYIGQEKLSLTGTIQDLWVPTNNLGCFANCFVLDDLYKTVSFLVLRDVW